MRDVEVPGRDVVHVSPWDSGGVVSPGCIRSPPCN